MFKLVIKIERVSFVETGFAKWLNKVYKANGGRGAEGPMLRAPQPIPASGNWIARLAARVYVAIRTNEQDAEADKFRARWGPLTTKMLNRKWGGLPGKMRDDLIITDAEYLVLYGEPRKRPQLGTFTDCHSDWGNPNDPDRTSSSSNG